MPATSKTVCVPCRKVWAGGGSSNRSNKGDKRILTLAPSTGCPLCKGETVSVSYRWRAPRRNDDRAWKRIAAGDWLTEQDPKDRTPGWGSHWGARISAAARRRQKAATPPEWLYGKSR